MTLPVTPPEPHNRRRLTNAAQSSAAATRKRHKAAASDGVHVDWPSAIARVKTILDERPAK